MNTLSAYRDDIFSLMSIEKTPDRNSEPERKSASGFVRGVALGSSILAGGLAGGYAGVTEGLEAINAHILTPRAIHQLKQEANATDADIGKLEAQLAKTLLSELERIKHDQ
jgi:hypothetical protein